MDVTEPGKMSSRFWGSFSYSAIWGQGNQSTLFSFKKSIKCVPKWGKALLRGGLGVSEAYNPNKMQYTSSGRVSKWGKTLLPQLNEPISGAAIQSPIKH